MEISSLFCERFACEPTYKVTAPARAELVGNHTDHNGGKVFCMAIDRCIEAYVCAIPKNIVRILAEGYEEITVSLSELSPVEREKGTSAALVRGVASELLRSGYDIGGFCAYIRSAIPVGAGLSSSAAFSLLIAETFMCLYNTKREDNKAKLAQIATVAENKHFGKPCGGMDQIACANGGFVQIDFAGAAPSAKTIECGANILNDFAFVLVTPNDSHVGLNAEYAEIPSDMRLVAEFFGKKLLSEVTGLEFAKRREEVARFSGLRAAARAQHFFDENERVSNCVQCAVNDDKDGFLKLIRESGRSSETLLQNIISPTGAGEGVMAALRVAKGFLGDVGACRIHGGGFGGSTLNVMPRFLLDGFIDKMHREFLRDVCMIVRSRQAGVSCACLNGDDRAE